MKRVLIFYLFFASTLAMANTTLQSCLGIKEDTLRLKCYDDIAYKVNQVTTELEEITISNTKEESKNDLGILERTFGLPKNKQKKKTDAKNINITSTITKLLQNNNYKIVIFLENGQKWESIEKIRRVRLKENQEVEISKARVSGYRLKVLGEKITIRVKRKE
tara:strand:+ start:15025 stop:15513 length:489 start_codon:yes stop_codon:yes gene_type:complete